MYCFESCIRSHKTTGVVETYVSTGGVTIKTNSILHSIEVSFDVFQYTVNDEDDTFAEPEPDESTRSNPFTPFDKVSTVSVVKDKSEEDKSENPDFYRDYSLPEYIGSGHAVDPYEIDTDYPVKDKSEEDKAEDPDYYRDYAVDPDSPR